MWVWAEEPVAVQTFESLGIKSIPLPVPEVLQGLRMGLINAIYTSPLVCLSFQWFTGIKYMLEINMRYEPGVVVITKKAWETLSPFDQKVILNTVRQNILGIIAQTRKDNKQSFEAILQSGVKLITLTPDEREVFRSRAMSVWDGFADKKYPRSLLEEIVKALKEYRQKHAF
jgi:TRAP-type C4-dicarboxylate transport system substrate-binding protein